MGVTHHPLDHFCHPFLKPSQLYSIFLEKKQSISTGQYAKLQGVSRTSLDNSPTQSVFRKNHLCSTKRYNCREAANKSPIYTKLNAFSRKWLSTQNLPKSTAGLQNKGDKEKTRCYFRASIDAYGDCAHL